MNKPGSVPMRVTPHGCLSLVYDMGHPMPLSIYPSTSDEQPYCVGIHDLSTHDAYCDTVSLPVRWALTPPFHPYSPRTAVLFCYANMPHDIFPLGSMALCVAQTFLSCAGNPTHQRQASLLLSFLFSLLNHKGTYYPALTSNLCSSDLPYEPFKSIIIAEMLLFGGIPLQANFGA